ncbi:MAG: hypothetical protein JNJ54_05155 [Myxococcaceae bacterium]|nr:hypothetical protein [Myxococcaceae bacterium]
MTLARPIAVVLSLLIVRVAYADGFADKPSRSIERDEYLDAVERGDAAATRSALKSGRGTPDAFSGFHSLDATPLAVAVLRGHVEVVKVLLAEKANIDAAEHARGLPPGWTLRCAAALHGPALEQLVSVAKAGTTEGCLSEVRFIGAAGRGSVKAITTATFAEGLSLEAAELALSAAVKTGKPEVVKAVIRASRNPALARHVRLEFVADPAVRSALSSNDASE